jgi:hypothetical protein
MSSRVVIAFASVFSLGDRLSRRIDNHCPNWHIPSITRGLGKRDRPLHPLSMLQVVWMVKGFRN